MYDHVIVPYDGSLPARAILAPAADLAWRCGARVVMVSNTDANDTASRAVLKSRAMSLSGDDVDFWVDTDRDLGTGVVEAARNRSNAIVAIPVRTRSGGLRRRPVMGAMPTQVLVESPVPVLVIGPEADVSRGLAMTELLVALDGSEASQQVLPLAVEWACELELDLVLVGVVRMGGSDEAGHVAEASYLEAQLAAVTGRVPDATTKLIEADDPASGLCAELAQRDSAIIAMSTHGRTGVDNHPLGSVAQGVLLHSPRPVLFVRPS